MLSQHGLGVSGFIDQNRMTVTNRFQGIILWLISRKPYMGEEGLNSDRMYFSLVMLETYDTLHCEYMHTDDNTLIVNTGGGLTLF